MLQRHQQLLLLCSLVREEGGGVVRFHWKACSLSIHEVPEGGSHDDCAAAVVRLRGGVLVIVLHLLLYLPYQVVGVVALVVIVVLVRLRRDPRPAIVSTTATTTTTAHGCERWEGRTIRREVCLIM